MFFKSIRPGNKKGDPVVTEIKALIYETNKEVSYKLRFLEDWSNLLLSRNSSTQTPISIDITTTTQSQNQYQKRKI